jgi:hypothetical protein
LNRLDEAPVFHQGAWVSKIVATLAAVVITCVTALVIEFSDQPPLDNYAFRQAQTALTSYWFQREGYELAYQTPVAGYPWALPFEFPLYQAMVAAISQASGMSIATVGRLVSYGFLLVSLPVVWSINRRLALPPLVFFCFVTLTLTTPVYFYWGRAVLIETTALFFVLLAIKYFLDYLLGDRSLGKLLLFSVFMTLCMLQKVTTGLPVLIVLVAVCCILEVKQAWAARQICIPKWVALVLLLILPLVISYVWTQYADFVKRENPFGESLTSSALSKWNWGSFEQRFSANLWSDVVSTRILNQNLGGFLGGAIIAVSLWLDVRRRTKVAMMIAVVMGLLPLLLFANLHIVHTYYQSANLIFFVYAVAIALGAAVVPRAGTPIALMLLFFLLVTNCRAIVQTGYLHAMMSTFGKSDRDVVVGEILKRELPVDGQFVAFGNDWSSTFAFQSERKSFTVPTWFKDYDRVVARPGDYVESGHLGAVVACSDKPSVGQILAWSEVQGGWKVGEASGCAIAVPTLPAPSAPELGNCRGSIDTADIVERDGLRIITVSGWSATASTPAAAADQVYLVLTQAGKPPLYFETLRIPRLDVNSAFGLGEETDFGFSRLLTAKIPSGLYEVALVQIIGGRAIACPINRSLTLP